MLMIYAIAPRTQKAKGIKALALRDLYVLPLGLPLPNVSSPRHAVELAILPYQKPFFPAFARPCPMTPRHGFADSRVVRSEAELLDLMLNTLRADPKGEVVLMKPLEGRFSAVMNNAGVMWARGNDGVTGGTSKAFVFPAPTKNWARCFSLSSCGVKVSPWFEFVTHRTDGKEVSYCVQVRDGPEVECLRDYVASNDPVEHVFVPGDMDLLAWETFIKSAPVKGSVVHLPDGSLASHYAVHAIQRGISVWCGPEEPTYGEPLSAPKTTIPKLTKADAKEIAGHLDVKNWSKVFGTELVSLGIGVVHASSVWGNEPHLLRARGHGIMALAHAAATACVGEMRYWGQYGPGRHSIDGSFADIPALKRLVSGGSKHGPRSAVYAGCLDVDFIEHAQWLSVLADDFDHPDWSDRSYGKGPWAHCCRTTHMLLHELSVFRSNPTANNWDSVMQAANLVVNCAHNGGKLLNKFTEHMETYARAPALAFTSAIAGAIACGEDCLPAKVVHSRDTR